MSPEHKQKNEEGSPAGEPTKEEQRVLLNPEEWKEPAGRKVIGEYHKDGLPEGASSGDADLDSFARYWGDKGNSKLKSEYHKEGAPYMEAPSDWDGHRPRLGETPSRTAEQRALVGTERTRADGEKAVVKRPHMDEGRERSPAAATVAPLAAAPIIERVLDVSTIEVLTFAMFRAIFGRGVHIPLKVEGVIDMNIVVKDKDIVLNTNELMFEVPELSVWRFIFSYKGRPVIEYGRGVKNRIKIYRVRMFLVLLAMWWGGRKKRKALEKASEAKGRAEASYAAAKGGTKGKDGAGRK